jgi:NAD+ kinase
VSQTRHLGLIANDSKPGARELVQTLSREFRRHHIQVHLDHRAGTLIGAETSMSEPELAEACELLVVLGGDGTILQVLHALGETLRPIFGINLGTLGFLTTVASTESLRAVEAIVNRKFQLSERTLLQVEVFRGGCRTAQRIALNDAVVSRGELSRLIRLAVRIGDDPVTEYNADGLIVATPTGSTAYSLSAGGPILAPDSGVFVVNPICPHVLTNRAVITSDATPIEIIPADQRSSIFLTLDGQVVHELEPGDLLRITKASKTLALAMLPGMSFFEVLRQKLKWSGAAV